MGRNGQNVGLSSFLGMSYLLGSQNEVSSCLLSLWCHSSTLAAQRTSFKRCGVADALRHICYIAWGTRCSDRRQEKCVSPPNAEGDLQSRYLSPLTNRLLKEEEPYAFS